MMNEEWVTARNLIDKCFEDESSDGLEATLEKIDVRVEKRFTEFEENPEVWANIWIEAKVLLK